MLLISYQKITKGWLGGLQRTGTPHVSASMNVIIPRTDTKTEEFVNCSQAPAKRSCSEPPKETPCLSGESLSTPLDKKALTALSSATKANGSPQSLSDRLTGSLILYGLVNGITPTSVRKLCGAQIRVTATSGLVGVDAGTPKEDLSSSNDHPATTQIFDTRNEKTALSPHHDD